jgi:hypothetical protein
MLSGAIAAQLRVMALDVIAVVDDPALVGMPDEELLIYATSVGRVLVTANVQDFAAIHASWSSRGQRTTTLHLNCGRFRAEWSDSGHNLGAKSAGEVRRIVHVDWQSRFLAVVVRDDRPDVVLTLRAS